jgi:predicted O-methyltransferase YrrM
VGCRVVGVLPYLPPNNSEIPEKDDGLFVCEGPPRSPVASWVGAVARVLPMPLPKALRRLTPDRIRHAPRFRAIALGAGVIPPRVMHSPAEADALARLARRARRVVELGVYEGSSALVLLRAMAPGAELHLVDPFVDESGWALRPGWRASPAATRRVIRRERPEGPTVHWHIARSQDLGRRWSGGPVDLVFIDGDHSPAGCREDWEVWHGHVSPRGAVAFHDARAGRPGGDGSPGPTSVVDDLFRGPDREWRIVEEVDTLVVVKRAVSEGGVARSASRTVTRAPTPDPPAGLPPLPSSSTSPHARRRDPLAIPAAG